MTAQRLPPLTATSYSLYVHHNTERLHLGWLRFPLAISATQLLRATEMSAADLHLWLPMHQRSTMESVVRSGAFCDDIWPSVRSWRRHCCHRTRAVRCEEMGTLFDTPALSPRMYISRFGKYSGGARSQKLNIH